MKVAYCTIATASYLNQVQVLENSVKKHSAGADFHILLCEWPLVCRRIAEQTGHHFYSPEDIGCKNWLQMAFYYDALEYICSFKAFFIMKLLNMGYEAVIYFDADIEVYSSLHDVEKLLLNHDLIVTPHVCKPVPDDSRVPSMDAYVRSGQFNMGFLGVRNSSESRELMTWWQAVCVNQCLFEHDHRFFADQFWATVFPSFIEKICILRDPAYNMAHWNVFQRKLELVDSKWQTESGELKFYHFSGLDKDEPTKVSAHQNRVSAPVGSDLYKLLVHYIESVRAQEWNLFKGEPYSFGQYANGQVISRDERRKFLFLNHIERDAIGNPFEAHEAIRALTCISRGAQLLVEEYMHNAAEGVRPGIIGLVRAYRDEVSRSGFRKANRISVGYLKQKLLHLLRRD